MHVSMEPNECNICMKKFPSKSKLKIHSRIHTGEKPYECHLCQKSFSQAAHLKSHIKVHTGEKPYECEVCKNTFTRNRSLKRHMRTHTGEKPYECNICKKSFSQDYILKMHLRIHTGEKPHECDVCKKSFTLNKYLQKHLRIHTHEKPYECNVCKKLFSHDHNLKKHMRGHTHEKPFECDICRREFSSAGALESHKTIHVSDKSQNSSKLLFSLSGSLEKSENTQSVCDDGNSMSLIKEQTLSSSDSENYSQHKVASHGDIEVYVDDIYPVFDSDAQVKKGPIHLSEEESCPITSVKCDENNFGHLKTTLEDSLEDISVKEEVDIHEIPFEDQSSEKYDNYSFCFKLEASCNDF